MNTYCDRLSSMLPRERVLAALDFTSPDVVPLEYHASPSGSYEHGERLHELWQRYPDDFGGGQRFPHPQPDPRWTNTQGQYRELRTDEWGVLWEFRRFGGGGHPVKGPLYDWSGLDEFKSPPAPAMSGPEFEREQARVRQVQQCYFVKSGWISIFEVMHAVRRFEDVLMDLAADGSEVNRLADLITECQLRRVEYLLARGVDAIQFGDDYATQTGLMMGLKLWRHFFKPRYEVLIKPIRCAGKKIFFHCCGHARKLLDDFADLGVHAIWPQISAYVPQEFRRACREARMAIALHPDRGDLMVRSSPREVRTAVFRLAEEYAVIDGGAWFYIEIDSGFPFENVQALIEAVADLRGLRRPRSGRGESGGVQWCL